MEIYKHYKSNLYRYHGLVKHSETLEELVSYECLYDNPECQNWVRPKSMFFENISLDNKSIPRFQKIDLTLELFTSITAERKKQLIELGQRLFPDSNETSVFEEWSSLADYQLIVASLEDKAIAFQLSYPLTRDVYFLWLEGVLPEFQGQGVASRLLTESEIWCSQNSYRKIIAKPLASEGKILILLISQGFQVSGIEESSRGIRVICEKNIPKS